MMTIAEYQPQFTADLKSAFDRYPSMRIWVLMRLAKILAPSYSNHMILELLDKSSLLTPEELLIMAEAIRINLPQIVDFIKKRWNADTPDIVRFIKNANLSFRPEEILRALHGVEKDPSRAVAYVNIHYPAFGYDEIRRALKESWRIDGTHLEEILITVDVDFQITNDIETADHEKMALAVSGIFGIEADVEEQKEEQEQGERT
jgi:hypothetical protein